MDPFDDELRHGLGQAAGAAERAASARPAPDAVQRAVSRHRAGVVGQVAAGTFAVVVLAVAAVRFLPAAGPDAGLSTAGHQEPSPTPSRPAASPGIATERPSPPPSTAPSPTRSVAPPADPTPTAPPASTRPSPTPHVAPPARAACQPPIAAGRPPAGVVVTVDTSSVSVRSDETVTLTVTVRNNGDEPVTYTHSGQRYDFWVSDQWGNAWTWSTGRAFAEYFANDTLDPGEEMTESVTWDLTECPHPNGSPPRPVARGVYALRALWHGDAMKRQGWWSAAVRFEIT